MDVLWLTASGVERRRLDELPSLLGRDDGFVWLDIVLCDEQACRVLTEVFRFHPLAVQECTEPNPVPKLHVYGDHLFVVLLQAEAAGAGEVRLAEVNHFIGTRYLVTVHESADGAAGESVTVRQARTVLKRIEDGRFCPRSPGELGHALVTSGTHRTELLVTDLARRVGVLERRVLTREPGSTEMHIEEFFGVRHALLTICTIAAQSREIYTRMARFGRDLGPEAITWIEDLIDQFERLRSMAEAEKEFLQGVVDFYQTRTATKMNLAMERIALITALVLPITAIASIYGMNVIVNEGTDTAQLLVALVLMAAITIAMLTWARRQGWW